MDLCAINLDFNFVKSVLSYFNFSNHQWMNNYLVTYIERGVFNSTDIETIMQ